jgi:hypothetical protein
VNEREEGNHHAMVNAEHISGKNMCTCTPITDAYGGVCLPIDLCSLARTHTHTHTHTPTHILGKGDGTMNHQPVEGHHKALT